MGNSVCERLGGGGEHSPGRHGEAQPAVAVQHGRGLLQECRHLGALVDGPLHRQEAAVQLVNQAHVDHVAGTQTHTERIHTAVNVVLSC